MRPPEGTVGATRKCIVCGQPFTAFAKTQFKAEVAAQKAVLTHQLDHPYSAVVAATEKERRK
jgi:hypothetical protein